jgi:hypothetical protein
VNNFRISSFRAQCSFGSGTVVCRTFSLG